MNNGINVKLRMIENPTIKAQLIRWNLGNHKQRDQPVWAGLAEECHETPAKNWKSARARALAFAIFFTTKQTFHEVAKVEDVCTCMNLSLHSWFGSEVGRIRRWLGRTPEEVGCQKSREQKVKRLPELHNGKMRQRSKAKGEKWQAQGIKINTQT